jgi:HD superfamily phosphodiesterase
MDVVEMKYLSDVRTTFDSIVFEWDECKSNIQNAYEFAVVFLKITDPYDKLSTRVMEHTLRTMKIAERIMNKECVDKEIVLVSLLLHDISKTLCENSHNLLSFRLAELFFEKYNYLDKKKKKILDCILYHSAKDLETIDLTPEMKVVMDADIIDEIGILLISRISLRTMNKNYSINELIKTVDNKYSKIDRETAYLKTKTGKDIYLQKKKKLKEYIDNFKMEISEYKIYK